MLDLDPSHTPEKPRPPHQVAARAFEYFRKSPACTILDLLDPIMPSGIASTTPRST
jgi:hypothetical protein